MNFYNYTVLDNPKTLLHWLCFWFTRANFEELSLDTHDFADLQYFSLEEDKKRARLAAAKGYLTVREQKTSCKCRLTETGKKILTLYSIFEAL